MSWYKGVLIVGVALALFVQVYFDAHVPEPIQEKWTVKTIEVMMKTYGHMVSVMSMFGYGGPYSPKGRQLADTFILLQTTGSPWGLGDDPDLKIHDSVYEGVPVRVFEPVIQQSHQSLRPVVIYFHGGGWTLLSIDSHDPLTRKLAKDTGYVVISVDYRLAPEHTYPAAFDDCLTVVEYVLDNAASMKLDPARIAVAGDSAGGNLAAAVSLRLKERLAVQVLIVPTLQFLNFNTTGFNENPNYLGKSVNHPSIVANILYYGGFDESLLSDFLANNHTSIEVKKSKYSEYSNPEILVPNYYIRDIALRDSKGRRDFGNSEIWNSVKDRLLDPYFAPLMVDETLLKETPRVYIMTAGYDLIRDDGIMYSSRLKAAGVKTIIRNFPDAFHHAYMFHSGPLRVNVGTRIVQDVVNFLKHNL